MADNLFPEATVTPSSNKLAFAETTFGGDTVFVGASFLGVITGAEGSRTFTPVVAGAGAVDGGTQRMTLASDDPAVVALQLLDNAVSGNSLVISDGGGEITVNQGGVVPWSCSVGNTVTVSGGVTAIGTVASGSTDNGDAPVKIGAIYNTSLPTFDNLDVCNIQADVNGRILVTGSGGTFPVTDSGGSLTVDNSTLAVVGGGTEAAAMRVTIASDSTGVLSVDDNGGSLTVDGTVTANLAAGTNNIGDVDILTIAAGDNNIGNVDIVTVPTDPFGANADAASATGSISAKLRFIASTGIPITGTVTVGSHAVTNAGTFVVQIDGTALTRLTDIETNTDSGAVVGNGAAATAQRVTIANDSTGILAGVTTVTTVTTCSTVTTVSTLTGSGVAHDAPDSGNPHKIGAKATTALSSKTMVANDDRTDLFAATDGVLLTRNVCLEDVVQERTTNTDGASTAFASGLAAPGANIRLWITSVTIANSSASFCTVDLRDGSAGSVLWTCPVPATGGFTFKFDPPLKLTANTALAFDASAATSTLSISANGFKSKL